MTDQERPIENFTDQERPVSPKAAKFGKGKFSKAKFGKEDGWIDQERPND